MFRTSRNAHMERIRKDVRDLITINERLQSALIQGKRLTPEETNIVQVCANELLSRALAKEPVPSVDALT